MTDTPRRRRVPLIATTTEEAALVRSINSAVKQSEGKFCCGGSIPVPSQDIRIWYSKDEDAQGLLHLPIATAYDDSGIEELVATCTGVLGGEELVSEMLPSSFATNFDLGHFFILDEIHRLLAPGNTLRAELHRLRIFQPGGRLKVQRPTEKTAGAATSDEDSEFGNLVVSLPVAFTGGDLVVSAGTSGRSHRFSWGGEPLDRVFWAAFVSDSEQELSEVTSGYMLTLTYKLYKLPDTNKRKRVLGVSGTLIDPHTLPVYEILWSALQCPKFCSDGGILGFACQHQYSINKKMKYKDMSRDDKTWLLKGADAMLFAAAKSVGLKAELRPIYKNSSAENPAVLYVGKTIGEKVPGFLGEFDKDFEGLDNETLGIEELPTARDGVKTDVEISWCLKNLSWVAGQSKGDEVVEVPWYHASAVVLTIPSWEERQEKLLAEDGVPTSKKTKVYEDAISAWFRKAEERASREIDYEYRAENPEDGEEEEEDDDVVDDDDDDDDEEDEEDEDDEDDEDDAEEDDSEEDGGDGDEEKTQDEEKHEEANEKDEKDKVH